MVLALPAGTGRAEDIGPRERDQLSRGIRNGDLVLVKWLDASTCSSWMDEKEFMEYPLVECETVARLINRSGKVIRLAGSKTNEGKLHDTTVIPKSWVLEIIPLSIKEPK